MPGIMDRMKRTWNAFMGRDPTYPYSYGYGTSYRPDRIRLTGVNTKSIVASIYNRIAIDCSQVDIRHVRLDGEFGRYKETIDSSLNRCLSTEANIDQTGRALIQDAVMSMFDEGCVALFATDYDVDPLRTDSYRVEAIRTGKIKEWYPKSIKVEVYNDLIGKKQDIVVEKRLTPIIENPFYATMNEPNSILQRLLRLLSQVDQTNEAASANKLDMIVQLPYAAKSPAKREYAESRRRSIEEQLTGSKLGLAYIDAMERVIQLNRPIENNLWDQAKDLQTQLFNQLGLTESIFDGSADEKTLLNYYNRTIEPILSAISLEIERKWLSQTARSQNQAIRFFRDPFKLVPVNDLAETADKFTRNEIMTSNEFRSIIGMRPSNDPKADQLVNSNISQPQDNNTNQMADQLSKSAEDSNNDSEEV